MTVQVVLSATLRAFVPGYDPAGGVPVELPAGSPAGEVCRRLGIPPEKVRVYMVNGRHAEPTDPLRGGERVALFPPVGGG